MDKVNERLYNIEEQLECLNDNLRNVNDRLDTLINNLQFLPINTSEEVIRKMENK